MIKVLIFGLQVVFFMKCLQDFYLIIYLELIQVKYPPDLNPIAINFINDLLNLDPNKRLGSGENGFNNIKSHEYFKDINWDKYLKKEIKPPFVPELDDDLDLKYFDKMFTEEPIDSNRPT